MATVPLPNSALSNRTLLKVSPKELIFAPPFNRVITNVLRLQNTSSDSSVAYKVKTTAPQRYCVRPNTGTILPLETAEVTVSVNLSNSKEQLPSEGKDKFQIQAIKITQAYNDIKEVWSRASEDDIKKQKLKALFLLPSTSSPSTPSSSSSTNNNNAPIISDLTTTQPSTPTSTITTNTPPSTPTPLTHTPPNSTSLLLESSMTSSFIENNTVPSSTFSSFSVLPSEYHQAVSTVPVSNAPIVDTQAGMRKVIDEMNERLSTVSNERDSLFKQIFLLNQQISQLKEISLHQKKEEEDMSTATIRHRKGAPVVHSPQAASITSSFIRDPTVVLTYSFRGFPIIIVHKGEEVQFLLLIFIVFLVSFLLGLLL